MKQITGLSFLIFFFIILIGPLYIFSDIFPQKVKNEIKSATMVVKA